MSKLKEFKCKFCGSKDFTLMVDMPDKGHSYIYHYGDYDKGCRQRIGLLETSKYMEWCL